MQTIRTTQKQLIQRTARQLQLDHDHHDVSESNQETEVEVGTG